VLDPDAIEGFSRELVGKNGIGALYARTQYAGRTWEAASWFTEEGGAAPQAHVSDRRYRHPHSRSGKNQMHHASDNASMFGMPIVSDKVRTLFEHRGIAPHYSNVLKAVGPGRKVVTFTTPDEMAK
jgi:sulfide:quinone oxidoreductase